MHIKHSSAGFIVSSIDFNLCITIYMLENAVRIEHTIETATSDASSR